MTDRELLQQALDALEKHVYEYETIQAIRTRLAQPEPEPVAWLSPRNRIYRFVVEAVANGEQTVSPLYTEPPKKEWVGLTDEEIEQAYRSVYRNEADLVDCNFADELEAKLKDKNT